MKTKPLDKPALKVLADSLEPVLLRITKESARMHRQGFDNQDMHFVFHHIDMCRSRLNALSK